MLDNGSIAELLTLEAEEASEHWKIALKRAAKSAFMWPEEAADLVKRGQSLTELPGIGPSLAHKLHRWMESPPKISRPLIRQEFLTLAKARKILGKNPKRLKQLRGDLQMHTVWSDGAGTLEDMAEAAVERGYQYIGITDHTKGLKIAGGMNEERLRKQGQEIVALNKNLKKRGFVILKSAEVNLSPAGESDMSRASLRKLDVVLGCFHSSLRRSEDQTERYLAGLRNPDIQILGHPQTRVYNHREGLAADWPRVFAEAAKLDKAVEIDGYVSRQDLRVSLLKIARQEGCRISLGTDAHEPAQLAYMELSLAAAQLAKIPPDRILNFLPVEKLLDWAETVRRG
jgi:histidinol phosphatase-like PHP family hydrolase